MSNEETTSVSSVVIETKEHTNKRTKSNRKKNTSNSNFKLQCKHWWIRNKRKTLYFIAFSVICALTIGITIAVIASATGHSPSDIAKQAFDDFKQNTKPAYKSAMEEAYRFSIFQDRLLNLIPRLNAQYSDGKVRFKVNFLSDRTDEEFRSMLGLIIEDLHLPEKRNIVLNRTDPNYWNISEPINWSGTNNPAHVPLATNVKDQMMSPCCYCFSAVTASETNYAIYNGGNVYEFSTEVACSCAGKAVPTGKTPCGNGGWPVYVFLSMIEKGNARTNINTYFHDFLAYHDGSNLRSCDSIKDMISVYFKDWCVFQVFTEEQIVHALVNYGVISIAIDSSKWAYWSGDEIIDDPILCSSSPGDMNHAVVLTGWGRETIAPYREYWIVRNSWTSKWSDGGYARILKNQLNTCGVMNQALVFAPRSISPYCIVD